MPCTKAWELTVAAPCSAATRGTGGYLETLESRGGGGGNKGKLKYRSRQTCLLIIAR